MKVFYDFKQIAANSCVMLQQELLAQEKQNIVIIPAKSHSPSDIIKETFSNKEFTEVICVNIKTQEMKNVS